MVRQIRKSYQSDISDKDWQIIEPYIPKPRTKRGRKRERPLRFFIMILTVQVRGIGNILGKSLYSIAVLYIRLWSRFSIIDVKRYSIKNIN